MKFVQCGSAVHAYVERPPRDVARPGTAIVFANALGTDHRIWAEVAARLPAALRVVCFDQRGHGLSDLGDTPYDVHGLAADLAELMQRLELGPSVVCGLSVGGLVAQALALDHPSLVSALGLFGTASRIGSEPAWNERIERVRREGIATIAPAVVERWFGPELREQQPEKVRGYQLLLERTPVEGYLATLAALKTADLTDRVSGIRCPALVVSGGRDAATPAEQGRTLASAIPAAHFALLSEAAHLMSVDQPAALVDRLLAFLAEHSLV